MKKNHAGFGQRAFTVLQVLMMIAGIAVLSGVFYYRFSGGARNWERGIQPKPAAEAARADQTRPSQS